jgi:hypothetical protein
MPAGATPAAENGDDTMAGLRLLIINALRVIAYVALISIIVAGAVAGYQQAIYYDPAFDPAMGAVAGGLVGLVTGLVVTGIVILLIDISDNTRRTRDLLEEAAKRFEDAGE